MEVHLSRRPRELKRQLAEIFGEERVNKERYFTDPDWSVDYKFEEHGAKCWCTAKIFHCNVITNTAVPGTAAIIGDVCASHFIPEEKLEAVKQQRKEATLRRKGHVCLVCDKVLHNRRKRIQQKERVCTEACLEVLCRREGRVCVVCDTILDNLDICMQAEGRVCSDPCLQQTKRQLQRAKIRAEHIQNHQGVCRRCHSVMVFNVMPRDGEHFVQATYEAFSKGLCTECARTDQVEHHQRVCQRCHSGIVCNITPREGELFVEATDEAFAERMCTVCFRETYTKTCPQCQQAFCAVKPWKKLCTPCYRDRPTTQRACALCQTQFSAAEAWKQLCSSCYSGVCGRPTCGERVTRKVVSKSAKNKGKVYYKCEGCHKFEFLT